MSEKKRQRRTFDDAMKTKIVLESLKETEPLTALASRYNVHPNQIGIWRKQFLQNASMAFSGDKEKNRENETLKKELDEAKKMVGELTLDKNFLKKKCRQLGLI